VHIVTLPVTFFLALLSLFLFWRSLKEDYLSENIFRSFFWLFGAGALGAIILGKAAVGFLAPTAVFSPEGMWFWGAFIAGSLSGFFIAKKLKINPFELFEAALPGVYLFVAAFSFVVFSRNNIRFALYHGLFVVFLILVKWLLDGHYRRFFWYRSGKVGFSALATSGVYFLTRTVFSWVFPEAALTIGKADSVLAGVSAFLILFVLYNRASD